MLKAVGTEARKEIEDAFSELKKIAAERGTVDE